MFYFAIFRIFLDYRRQYVSFLITYRQDLSVLNGKSFWNSIYKIVRMTSAMFCRIWSHDSNLCDRSNRAFNESFTKTIQAQYRMKSMHFNTESLPSDRSMGTPWTFISTIFVDRMTVEAHFVLVLTFLMVYLLHFKKNSMCWIFRMVIPIRVEFIIGCCSTKSICWKLQ